MPERGYHISNQQAVHFITFAVVQWIDVFTRKEYADIVVDSLKFCQRNKGLKIHAWCIMSNHLHLILSVDEPFRLSDVLRDFKKFTSGTLIKSIEDNKQESRKSWMLWIFRKAGEKNNRNEYCQFWQQDNHPIECSTNEILDSRMKYLHQNPLRAGLVRNESDFIYSSAINYYDDADGLIQIDYV